MDSYTLVLCTAAGGAARGLLRAGVADTLSELAQTPGGVAGDAYVAVVASTARRPPAWRRLDSVTDADAMITGPTDSAAAVAVAPSMAGVCASLDQLNDELPERDVVVTLVWLCAARERPAGGSGLAASLLRYRLWRRAVFRLHASGVGGGGAELAAWRRLLHADEAAPLRPTLRASLWLPDAPTAAAVPLEATCDSAEWEQLTTAAAAAHGLAAADRHLVALALHDGVDVVARVAAGSVPADAMTGCVMRVRTPGRPVSWGGGRGALLLRLLHGTQSGAARDAAAWEQQRHLLADGRPAGRRAPPPRCRQLHFLLTAAAAGSDTSLLTMLDTAAALRLLVKEAAESARLPELSVSELQALAASTSSLMSPVAKPAGSLTKAPRAGRFRTAAADGATDLSEDDTAAWLRATKLIDRLWLPPEGPATWPERRGLAHWTALHRERAADAGRPAADSLVLDADGILGAFRSAGAAAWYRSAAAEEPDWTSAVVQAGWPAAAALAAPGLQYNLSAEAERAEAAGGAVKQRCVANETACTCSVWRSDVVSVTTGGRRQPAAARRQSPRKRSGRPSRPDGAATPPRLPADPASSERAGGRRGHAASEARHRLMKAICAALSERDVSSRHPLFRGCARKLSAIVRAYTADVKVAGGASVRQMLQFARVHVTHVIEVQRELDAAGDGCRRM